MSRSNQRSGLLKILQIEGVEDQRAWSPVLGCDVTSDDEPCGDHKFRRETGDCDQVFQCIPDRLPGERNSGAARTEPGFEVCDQSVLGRRPLGDPFNIASQDAWEGPCKTRDRNGESFQWPPILVQHHGGGNCVVRWEPVELGVRKLRQHSRDGGSHRNRAEYEVKVDRAAGPGEGLRVFPR